MIPTPTIDVKLPYDYLMPISKGLLIASFGVSLTRAMRDSGTLEGAFERLAIGLLGLIFYREAGAWLTVFGNQLYDSISHIGDTESLRDYLADAFRRSASMPTGDSTSFNVPAVAAQLLRTGIWGLFTGAAEFLFMVTALILQAAQAVLWSLLLFLFPVACGLYPLLPRMMANLSIYAVELTLWMPILALVDIVTGQTAKAFLGKQDSLGLYIVAVELFAVLLMISIPMVAHRFLSGAFSGDFGGGSGVYAHAKRLVLRAKLWDAKK